MEMGYLERMFDFDGDGMLNAAESEVYFNYIGLWLAKESLS